MFVGSSSTIVFERSLEIIFYICTLNIITTFVIPSALVLWFYSWEFCGCRLLYWLLTKLRFRKLSSSKRKEVDCCLFGFEFSTGNFYSVDNARTIRSVTSTAGYLSSYRATSVSMTSASLTCSASTHNLYFRKKFKASFKRDSTNLRWRWEIEMMRY